MNGGAGVILVGDQESVNGGARVMSLVQRGSLLGLWLY